MKRGSVALMLMLAVMAGGAATKAGALELDNGGNQGFMTEWDDPAPSAGDRLQVEFRAVKDIYTVGEPISFRLMTNRPAYVYLFSLGEEGEGLIPLFPNRYEQGNLLRSHKAVLLPGRRSTFRSEQPGVERVILVASERPLNLKGTAFRELAADLEAGFAREYLDSIQGERSEFRPHGGRLLVRELDILVKADD